MRLQNVALSRAAFIWELLRKKNARENGKLFDWHLRRSTAERTSTRLSSNLSFYSLLNTKWYEINIQIKLKKLEPGVPLPSPENLKYKILCKFRKKLSMKHKKENFKENQIHFYLFTKQKKPTIEI